MKIIIMVGTLYQYYEAQYITAVLNLRYMYLRVYAPQIQRVSQLSSEIKKYIIALAPDTKKVPNAQSVGPTLHITNRASDAIVSRALFG